MKKILVILTFGFLLALLGLLPASTALAAPPAPILISPPNGSVVTSTTLILDWSDVVASPPVNLYLVVISNNVSFSAPISMVITTSHCTFPVPLTPGQRWWWYVQASNDGGLTWGPPSAIWNFYVQAPAVMVTPAQGPPGTTVTVYGSGWAPGEVIKIYYDGFLQHVVETIGGSWRATIVATGSAGYHTVTATGNVSGTHNTNFIILGPARYITQSATQGPPGTVLTISGYNFNPGETVYVTFAGSVVAQGIADYTGSFSLFFTIPERLAGSYIIDAYGTLTSPTSVADLTFSIVPAISISPTTAKAGEPLTVTGKSFRPFSAINLGYDGKSASTTSDISGRFNTVISAPNQSGQYTLIATDASGNSATASFSVVNPISVTVGPSIGAIGEELIISGNSSAPGRVTIAYDGQTMGSTMSGADGSFVFSFRVPKSAAGNHIISITDSVGNTASATFTVESSPPPTPTPIKPGYDSRSGWSRDVTFSWEEVSDPSGVVYNLRVYDSAQKDVLNISGITTSHCKASLPNEGKFYWSVQAEDGAGNTSDWSAPIPFTAGPPIPIWTIVVIVIAALLLAGLAYYFLYVGRVSISFVRSSQPRGQGRGRRG